VRIRFSARAASFAAVLAALLAAASACVAAMSDSKSCSGDIDLSNMRLKSGSSSGLSLVLFATQLN